jgi:hypothetical protein
MQIFNLSILTCLLSAGQASAFDWPFTQFKPHDTQESSETQELSACCPCFDFNPYSIEEEPQEDKDE